MKLQLVAVGANAGLEYKPVFTEYLRHFPKICRSSWWDPRRKARQNADIKRILDKGEN